MSTADISRFLRQPGKHYAGARLQQGRILTDADHNEGSWLGEEDRRKDLADFVGPRGSPDQGFSLGDAITLDPLDTDPHPGPVRPNDPLKADSFFLNDIPTLVRPVSIRAGAFYLGGMRVELETAQPIMFQRDFLQMVPDDIPSLDRSGDGLINCFYYLNAWEQEVSAVEDAELLEPALGGADTSLRVRRMRRVEMRSEATEGSCEEAFAGLIAKLEADNAQFDRATGELASKGRLFFTVDPTVDTGSCTDCNPRPSARFLGADNQTVRLMLTSADTFVWALDDGAPLYRVEVSDFDNPDGALVRLATPPRDEEHFPLEGRVVEILPFAALLDHQEVGDSRLDAYFNKAAAEIGAFTQVVQSYDPIEKTFRVALGDGIDKVQTFVHSWDHRHPDAEQLMVPTATPDVRAFYARFWHTSDPVKGPPVEIPIGASTGAGPTLGRTTLVPHFPQRGRAGDFWVAALRPDTPDQLVVPFDLLNQLRGLPPDGPRHFYAPIAFLHGDGDVVTTSEDCRLRVRPLADDGCTNVTVGDCRTSVGQFEKIQDAIDALANEGGVVTILPGFYEQQVQIDRPNITLEGCGEDTVIQSTRGSNTLITLAGGATGTRIRNLRLNLVGGHGVFAQTSADDLTISGLHVVSGIITSSNLFEQRPDADEDPEFALLRLIGNRIIVEDSVLESGRRIGLQLDGCQGAFVVGLEVIGDSRQNLNLPVPGILIRDCTSVVVRDSSVHTFAQAGVQVTGTSRDVELSNVDVLAEPSVDGPVVAALRACDLEGTLLRLLGSRVRMTSLPAKNINFNTVGIDAAVVVRGTDIEIEGNHVEADEAPTGNGAAVWGGIQIRGGSTRVSVRGNHVVRGVGHGITLGSVAWHQQGISLVQFFGAGRTQIGSSASGGFGATGNITTVSTFVTSVPVSEGGLTDVVLVNNRIEQMSSNGISIIAMLGVFFDASVATTNFIDVDGLRVEGNTISGNVTHPPSNIQTTTTLVPVAITDQHFVNSILVGTIVPAALQKMALGGIVLSDVGTGAEIRNNVIRGNGANQLQRAINGIFILAGEAISICNNRITQNGAPPTSGTPDDAIRAGIAVLYAGTGAPAGTDDIEQVLSSGGNDLGNDGSSLRILNNVIRQPEGRAIYVVAAGPVTITGNFLSSDGFHGTGSEEFALGNIVMVQDMGGPWERFDVAQLDVTEPGVDGIFFTGYTTPPQAANYLFNQDPDSPRLFVGVGGQVLFNNNQVTLDWLLQRQPAQGVPLATFPVTIMTLDHLSMIGNQLALRVRGLSRPPGDDSGFPLEPILSHVFAAGATVEISGNRIADVVGLVASSIWSLGELVNFTTNNHMTHSLFAEATKSGGGVYRLVVGNQIMFDRILTGNPDPFLHLFFQLLFRTSLISPPDFRPPPPGST